MKTFLKTLKYFLKSIGLLLLLLISLGQTEIGNQYKNDQPSVQYLNIENNQIRYQQEGTGKDILFIHGTPGSLEDWDGLTDDLAQSYRITRFDRLGHGYTSSEGYDYHLSENAALVKNIVKKLNLKDP